MNNTTELLPGLIKKGDNFILGPYHFVCMGWENGRIRAMTYIPGKWLRMYSLSVDVVLLDPTFRMLKKQEVKP